MVAGQAFVLLWMAAIPLVQLWRLDNAAVFLVGTTATVALILGGLAVRPGAGRAWALAGTVLLGGGLLGGHLVLPSDLARQVSRFAGAPFSTDATDGQRVAGSAALIAGLVVVGWLALGLRGGGARLPRWVLLASLPVVALLVLVPGGAVWNLLPSALLVLVGLAVGRRILRLVLGAADSSGPLAWVGSICLGLGALSLVWLGLGTLRLLTPLPLVLSVLALLALAGRDAWILARALGTAPTWLAEPITLRQNATSLAVTALLAGLGLMNLIAALAPDLGYDAVMQHLAIAAVFARQGSLEPSPETQAYYWHIPVEVLYAGLTAWSGPVAAKVLHFWYGTLAAAGTGALATHLTGRREPGLVAAAVFSVPSLVWWVAGTAYVDLAITFYFLATVCALVRWVEADRRGWLVVAGLAAGVAIPSKLTSAPLGAVLLLIIGLRERRSHRGALGSLLTCGTPAFLTWSPWLIRSYLLSGNPVFPWFNQLFRSPLVEATAVWAGIPWGIGTSPLALLSLPFAVTFEPEKFVEVTEFGAHLLALSPLLLLLARHVRLRPSLALVFAAAAVFTIGWAYALLQNLRYLLPALPLFAVLLAAAYHEARLRASGHRVVSATVAALFLATIGNALNPGVWWFRDRSALGLPYDVVLGHQTPES